MLTPDRPTAHWGVLALPMLCLVGLAVTIWLDTQALSSGPGDDIAPELGWGYALNGVALAVMAAWLLLRNPRQGFGWAVAWFGLFWVLDGLVAVLRARRADRRRRLARDDVRAVVPQPVRRVPDRAGRR